MVRRVAKKIILKLVIINFKLLTVKFIGFDVRMVISEIS